MLVTGTCTDDEEAAVLVLETTVIPIGTNEVDTTVELAGQLWTPEEHEVTVVISVLYLVIVKGPPGFVSLVARYPTVPAGKGVVDDKSFALESPQVLAFGPLSI